MSSKVAVILSRFPFPLDKGDKLRAFHQLKYLSQFHEIYLFCLCTQEISRNDQKLVQPFCKEMVLLKIGTFDIIKGIIYSLYHKYPVQVGYFYSNKIKKRISREIASFQINTVYCQLSRTALYGKDIPAKRILDFQDAFSTNYLRLSETTKGIRKLFYQREYQTMHLFEHKILKWFDQFTIISEFDKSQVGPNHQKLHVIPNGVDSMYFEPIQTDKKFDILFVGNLSYLPNKNAVFFLVHQILPEILKIYPNIRIHIVGADTPQEIYALGGKNVFVSGFVKDIRTAYSEARIFVAPLFSGAGLQNKILEAMSMQIPCITTSIVNISVQAKMESEILIANSATEFIEKIQLLLGSEELQTRISLEARNFVMENFCWDVANKKLNGILE